MTEPIKDRNDGLINHRLRPVRDPAFYRALIPNRILYLLVPAAMHLFILTGYALFVENTVNWGLYADGTRHGYGLLRFALAGVSLTFVGYAVLRRRRALPALAEQLILRVAGILFVVGTTVEAMIDVANGGSPAMFSLTVLGAAIILYEPMRVIVPLFSLAAAAVAVVGATVDASEYSAVILVVQPIVAAMWAYGIYVVTISNRYGMWRTQQELAHRTRELEQSRAQLAEAVRMKNTVITAVGHDLRAPIAIVKNLIRVLDGPGGYEAANRTEIRHELNRTINSAELTTKNLLALRGEPSDGFGYGIGPVAIDTVIRDVKVITDGAGADKNIEIDFAPDDDTLVYGNGNMLVTTLRNLIDNAVKFTPIGGHIHIRTVVEPDVVRFEVVDSGVGIGEDVRRAVADGQSTASARGTNGETGLGIGLSVCHTFLMAQDSRLHLDEGEFGGTVAWFALPRYSVVRRRRSVTPLDELPPAAL